MSCSQAWSWSPRAEVVPLTPETAARNRSLISLVYFQANFVILCHKDTKLHGEQLSWDSLSSQALCSCLVDAQPCQHSHFYCVPLIPTASVGVGTICTKQQSWEMLQCQSWDRGANPAVECVCSPGNRCSSHTPKFLRSTCAQWNGLGYTDGHWLRTVWVISDACALPTGTCHSQRTEKNRFRWVLLLTSFPSQAF